MIKTNTFTHLKRQTGSGAGRLRDQRSETHSCHQGDKTFVKLVHGFFGIFFSFFSDFYFIQVKQMKFYYLEVYLVK